MKQKLLPNITLATKVTICRILGIPVFVLLLIYYCQGLKAGQPEEGYRIAALICFVVIAGTDALDGYLARSRNEITHLGRILDPLADKVLMLSALILLTRPSIETLQPQFPIWFTGLVISKDIFLVIGFMIIKHHSGSVFVHPPLSGKIATVLIMVSIGWVLARLPEQPFQVLLWVSTGLMVISWGQCTWAGAHQLEKEEPH